MQTAPKCPVRGLADFATWYNPGVAASCRAIHQDEDLAYEHTNKANTVAIVFHGTRVLGLGDIGPTAGLPVMEGKALLLKYLGGVDAVSLCLDTKDPYRMVLAVKWIQPAFGGVNLEDIANAKVNFSFAEGLARGILCNALVCLAVWLCLSGRSVTDKILAIVFPITAFVASSFEHSIANMYFIPMGLLLKGESQVVAAAGKVAGDLVNLNLQGLAGNLISVTTGNIFGGWFMVAVVYWFIYRRPQEGRSRISARRVLELFLSPRQPGNPTKRS